MNKSRKRWKREAPRGRFGALEKKVVAVTIEDIAYYGKLLELVDNRIKVINQMLGYTKLGDWTNPMRLVLDHGQYLVKMNDCVITEFNVYDIDGLKRAIDRIDGMNDGIWCALREGLLMVA